MADKILKDFIKRLTKIEQRLDKIEGMIDNRKSISTSKPINSSSTKKKKIVVIKAGNVTLTQYNNACTITGDTYDKRSIIKACRGWWIPKIKGWAVRSDNYVKIKKELKKVCKTLTEKSVERDLEGVSDTKKKPQKVQNSTSEDYGFISDSE